MVFSYFACRWLLRAEGVTPCIVSTVVACLERQHGAALPLAIRAGLLMACVPARCYCAYERRVSLLVFSRQDFPNLRFKLVFAGPRSTARCQPESDSPGKIVVATRCCWPPPRRAGSLSASTWGILESCGEHQDAGTVRCDYFGCCANSS